jgi:hypothetical protein
MDENTSLRNCTYGFQDGDRRIYSNLPEDCLRMWMDRLETTKQYDLLTKQHRPVIEEGKDLVIVNLDKRQLDHIVNELFPDFLNNAESRKVQTHRYPHHTADSFVNVWEPHGLKIYGEKELSSECLHQLKNIKDKIKLMYGRTKFKDSVTEKLVRLNAEEGIIGFNEKDLSPHHIAATDVNALTLVGSDDRACYDLKDEFDKNPHILSLGEERNFLANPKNTGYRALQQNYIWLKNTIPTGTIFTIHFETLADHPLNMHGNGTDERSHRFHGDKKYKMKHEQGNNQIIVLEKNGHDNNKLFPVRVANDFVKYTLINY